MEALMFPSHVAHSLIAHILPFIFLLQISEKLCRTDLCISTWKSHEFGQKLLLTSAFFPLILEPFTYEHTSYFCWKHIWPHDMAQPWLLSWPLTQLDKDFSWSEVVYPCQARLPAPSWQFLAALLSPRISWRNHSILYSSTFLNVSGRCLGLWFPGTFFPLWFGLSLSLPVLLLFLICYLVLDNLLCKMSAFFVLVVFFFFNRPWVKGYCSCSVYIRQKRNF